MNNISNKFIAELISKLVKTTEKGARFVGVTYTAKTSGEVARHVINVGIDYENCIRNSVIELESMIPTFTIDVQHEAATSLLDSFHNTLSNMQQGIANDNYTKKDIYVSICPGLKVNINDGTFELQGLQVSKKIIMPGTYKTVNSRPLTIAKNEIRSMLSVGSFRTLACDLGALETIRLGGTELAAA